PPSFGVADGALDAAAADDVAAPPPLGAPTHDARTGAAAAAAAPLRSVRLLTVFVGSLTHDLPARWRARYTRDRAMRQLGSTMRCALTRPPGQRSDDAIATASSFDTCASTR